jgi:hypothetical protein
LVLGFRVMPKEKRARFGVVRAMIATGFVAGGLVSGAARAQAVPRDPVTAEALFVDGKRLMQAHDYAAACPKLAESQRPDPSGGTIFALALCYEGAGKLATAWATFNDALSEARRDQRADREAAAAEHVHALEARLTRVRVDVPHPAPGLEILRNGVPIGAVLWSTAVPVDPGRYTFEAHAPGKVPWTWTTTIDRPGDVFTLSVPDLSNVPPALAPVEVVAVPGAVPSSRPSAAPHKRNWLPTEIALGATVVTAAVGIGVGLKASSDWSSAQADKTSARVNQASSAGTEADVATGFFVASGVGLAVSGVLLAITLSPDGDGGDADKPKSAFRLLPSVGPGSFGLSFGGTL